jgi:hypothetical protein
MEATPSNQHESESTEAIIAREPMMPQKRINTAEDFEKWKTGNAYRIYLQFILALNDSVKSKKLSVECYVSPVSIYCTDIDIANCESKSTLQHLVTYYDSM